MRSVQVIVVEIEIVLYWRHMRFKPLKTKLTARGCRLVDVPTAHAQMRLLSQSHMSTPNAGVWDETRSFFFLVSTLIMASDTSTDGVTADSSFSPSPLTPSPSPLPLTRWEVQRILWAACPMGAWSRA